MQRSLILYFSLHIDALDGEAALLIEGHRVIVLRVDAQLQICAAEGLCQRPNISHDLCTDALAAAFLPDAQFIHQHNLPLDNTGKIKITNLDQDIPHRKAIQLGNIELPFPDSIPKPFLRVLLLHQRVDIRPPGNMHGMDLPSHGIDRFPVCKNC